MKTKRSAEINAQLHAKLATGATPRLATETRVARLLFPYQGDTIIPEIKLWHDDVRPCPWDGWLWVKDNHHAMQVLQTGMVTECSLDHDLGAKPDHSDPTEVVYLRGDSQEGSGLDLARWMVFNRFVPNRITIHSWNPDGARQMALVFQAAGYPCELRPWTA